MQALWDKLNFVWSWQPTLNELIATQMLLIFCCSPVWRAMAAMAKSERTGLTGTRVRQIYIDLHEESRGETQVKSLNPKSLISKNRGGILLVRPDVVWQKGWKDAVCCFYLWWKPCNICNIFRLPAEYGAEIVRLWWDRMGDTVETATRIHQHAVDWS